MNIIFAYKFSSYEALGAVGSTSLLVTLFTGFLIGMGCGVNVRAAQQLGAGQRENVRKTIHTSFLLCLFVGFTAMVLCIAGAKFFLSLMNTKPELIDGAVLYFRIYAFGMPAMAVYNFGNAVMSASGDTKKPLIYLTFAGIVNVCLNLIFVIGIGIKTNDIHFSLKKICFRKAELKNRISEKKFSSFYRRKPVAIFETSEHFGTIRPFR